MTYRRKFDKTKYYSRIPQSWNRMEQERLAQLEKEAEQKMMLEEAYDIVSEANLRNELLYDIINSVKWSYMIGPDDSIVSYSYADRAEKTVDSETLEDLMSWGETLHPEDRERALEAFETVIHDRSGKTPYEVTYRLLDADGYCAWLKVSGRVILWDNGMRELFGISVEITDQMENERRNIARLEDAYRLVEDARRAEAEANRSKTNFLFNMSHDIRTPMNAIMGFTNMAKKHADDEKKVKDYLNKIDTSGQQLLTLINQVLEMARIESGRIELEETAVDIRMEFGSAVTTLAEQAKVSGLDFHHSFSDITHSHVFADVAKMNSIALNICGNAVKYTPKGGRIDFLLKEIPGKKEGYATFVLTVADTGIGMSAEYLKILYDPFTREKNSTVSRIQGTGLGMSIVKQLVNLMDGSIDVQSQPGRGTRFDVTLDFRIDEVSDAQPLNRQDATGISMKGRRVLLVEDNELNREIATEILEEKGISVDEAEDGAKAVSIVKEKGPDHYDLILMDIQMPVMNGYEATMAIREMYPEAEIPIIALSANAFEEDRKASREAGMNAHVAKPINIEELFSILEKYI